jgi:5-methylcytosine-specific restriction endonuclease McrA
MAFPDSVILAVWRRSEGKCECTRTSCGHGGRCSKALTKHNWHAHHKTAEAAGGEDTLSNCEALCVPCHQNTGTYGG